MTKQIGDQVEIRVDMVQADSLDKVGYFIAWVDVIEVLDNNALKVSHAGKEFVVEENQWQELLDCCAYEDGGRITKAPAAYVTTMSKEEAAEYMALKKALSETRDPVTADTKHSCHGIFQESIARSFTEEAEYSAHKCDAIMGKYGSSLNEFMTNGLKPN